jgi:hypothetical protein
MEWKVTKSGRKDHHGSSSRDESEASKEIKIRSVSLGYAVPALAALLMLVLVSDWTLSACSLSRLVSVFTSGESLSSKRGKGVTVNFVVASPLEVKAEEILPERRQRQDGTPASQVCVRNE